MMKNEISVLMPCTFYTGYVVQLRAYLKKYYPWLRVSVLTCKSEEYKYAKELGKLDDGEHIYTYKDDYLAHPHIYKAVRAVYVYRAIKDLPVFDIIHFLWMERKWCYFAHSFRKKCNSVYVSVGGSDLYKESTNRSGRSLQKKLVCIADIISSENSQTRNYFNSVHGNISKSIDHRVIRFGVDVIDAIIKNTDDKAKIKEKNGISPDRIVVTCGHNAYRDHQHERIIEAISKLDRDAINRLFLLFPMTYGSSNDGYIEYIESEVAKLTKHYRILRDFLDVDQMAEMTMMTDVFLHVQTTDQLSSTMMAHMFNENIVIAGSWLPYDDLKSSGIKFWEVDDFEILTSKLRDIINDIDRYFEECKGNADKVYKFSSWEYCSKEWYSAYQALL